MYQCDNCRREFKGKSGLTNHSKSCKPTEEITEEVVSDEVGNSQEVSDNIARKLEKLKDARSSTWDAQARHKIDMQIKELLNES